jgi:hemolysin activation/secretion protein
MKHGTLKIVDFAVLVLVPLLTAPGDATAAAQQTGAATTSANQNAAAIASTSGTATEATFDVLEYRVIGNTALADRDIERVLYPLLGKNKTLDDVKAARKALEDLYHERGFGTAFVDIPPQTVRDGLVRLHVTEGVLESRSIGGAKYFPERDVIAQLPAATPGQVLQLSKLQEQLTALNSQTADRSVVPVLKAGSEPGTVDLALTVNDTLPLHGSLELNNQATVDTHELRGIASMNYDNLFGRLDSLALQYQFTPQEFSQVRVFAANYAAHPFDSGLQPSVSYINSNSNVPTAGTLGVLGIGEITSAKLAYPVASSGASLQSISLDVDYKHFRNTINQNATTALDTPISYLNLAAAYAGSWRSDWRVTTFSISINGGPRHLVNNPESFENDRYQARANYFDVRADLATTFKLPADFGLKLRVAGQGAVDPLIANEDYALTGADGVRGYLEAEELVDAGVKETVQLISAPLRRGGRVLGDVFTFFDAGKGRVYDALPGQPGDIRVRSWGAGLDLLPGAKVTGSLSWAKALDTASVTRSGESRILFFLRGGF